MLRATEDNLDPSNEWIPKVLVETKGFLMFNGIDCDMPGRFGIGQINAKNLHSKFLSFFL